MAEFFPSWWRSTIFFFRLWPRWPRSTAHRASVVRWSVEKPARSLSLLPPWVSGAPPKLPVGPPQQARYDQSSGRAFFYQHRRVVCVDSARLCCSRLWDFVRVCFQEVNRGCSVVIISDLCIRVGTNSTECDWPRQQCRVFTIQARWLRIMVIPVCLVSLEWIIRVIRQQNDTIALLCAVIN
jgi:hypothetical protein